MPVVVATAAAAIVFGRGGGEPYAGTTVELTMFDYGFGGDLTAPAGAVRLEAKNTGLLNHNLGIRRGPSSGEVPAGSTARLDLDNIQPGNYELYCDIVGHAEKGMTAVLVITEPIAPDQP